MTAAAQPYPATLRIDYPEGPRDRIRALFRIFIALPILVVAVVVGGGSSPGVAGGVLFLGALLMILFRQKYPRWWFDWNLQLVRFQNRVGAFVCLLRDEYPSTDEEQAVHIEIAYPDAQNDLNRWLPLVKWILAIPHFVILVFLGIAAFVVTVIAWFAILFTGSYPRGMFDFVVGVGRWTLRVEAYAFLLTTDRYPPFSLE